MQAQVAEGQSPALRQRQFRSMQRYAGRHSVASRFRTSSQGSLNRHESQLAVCQASENAPHDALSPTAPSAELAGSSEEAASACSELLLRTGSVASEAQAINTPASIAGSWCLTGCNRLRILVPKRRFGKTAPRLMVHRDLRRCNSRLEHRSHRPGSERRSGS